MVSVRLSDEQGRFLARGSGANLAEAATVTYNREVKPAGVPDRSVLDIETISKSRRRVKFGNYIHVHAADVYATVLVDVE